MYMYLSMMVHEARLHRFTQAGLGGHVRERGGLPLGHDPRGPSPMIDPGGLADLGRHGGDRRWLPSTMIHVVFQRLIEETL